MPPLPSPTASAFGYPERRAIIVLERIPLSGNSNHERTIGLTHLANVYEPIVP